jgi:hypothetical protein
MTLDGYNNKEFLDQYGLNWLFDFLTPTNETAVYIPVNDELIEYDTTKKIIPVWNNGQAILSNIFTESIDSESTIFDYSLNVFSTKSCGDVFKEFTVEYGNIDGLATTTAYTTEKTETKAIYRKYQSIFGENEIEDYSHLYALKFHKSSSQDSLYSELFEIKLTNPATRSQYSDLVNLEYFQSQSRYELQPREIYNIVSGSLEHGIYYQNGSPIYFGKLYPKQAIAVFNGDALNTYINFNSQTGSGVSGRNAERFYKSISGSINNFNTKQYKYWAYVHAVIERQIMTMPIRVTPEQANYTTNPTYYDEYGRIRTNQFINDPNTYFTSIGFYNSKYELLAVAKLSKPFIKNFNETYMFQINLELK